MRISLCNEVVRDLDFAAPFTVVGGDTTELVLRFEVDRFFHDNGVVIDLAVAKRCDDGDPEATEVEGGRAHAGSFRQVDRGFNRRRANAGKRRKTTLRPRRSSDDGTAAPVR